jgi:hypothetical protein
MKVQVEEKPFLANGRHTTTITEVTEGKSENKGVPFFNCRFENEDGFVNHRFYLSEPGQPIMAELFQAVGIEESEVDTQELIGKEVSIEVHERTYPDPDSQQEKTIKEARHFRPAGQSEISTATK